jgi:hypothetical protein
MSEVGREEEKLEPELQAILDKDDTAIMLDELRELFGPDTDFDSRFTVAQILTAMESAHDQAVEFCHMVERAKAEADRTASRPIADEWQPIETAPKDGSCVLVTGRFGGRQRPIPCDAWQRTPRIVWFEMHRTWLGFPSGKALDGEPTHWRPLPEPPAITTIQAQG